MLYHKDNSCKNDNRLIYYYVILRQILSFTFKIIQTLLLIVLRLFLVLLNELVTYITFLTQQYLKNTISFIKSHIHSQISKIIIY